MENWNDNSNFGSLFFNIVSLEVLALGVISCAI